MRFKQTKQPVCDKYYELPATRSRRTTSFGVGDRFHCPLKTTMPPPGAYQSPSDFNKSVDKGFSFGCHRDAYKKVYMKNRPKMSDPDMPGPGYYPVKSFVENVKTDSKVFTLGKKNHYAFPMNYPSLPGPGYYDQQGELSRTGYYFNSKFQTSGAQKWATGDRNFLKIRNQMPGPGTYDPKDCINPEGVYCLSTYKNSVTRRFGRQSTSMCETSRREESRDMYTQLKTGTPGPGTYRVYSEFGKVEYQPYATMGNSSRHHSRPKSSVANSKFINSVVVESRPTDYDTIPKAIEQSL